MTLCEDVLIGAKAIAKETGIKVRQVYRLAELGSIPTFKIGGTLAARKSELRKRLTSERAEAGHG
jgi:hypothetical protein